uniref:DDE Tnp4 domain-containing protein n=1 Tax=Ditylenchus dipsaci TaxID=166011 RepID=A0A915EPE5_9BILA
MASGSSSTRITRAQTNRTDRFVDSTPTLGPKSIDALSKLTDLEERLQQTTSQTQNELHQQRLAYVKQQLQETREDSALLNAIAWWFLRKRRSYVRPAHYQAAFQRNSFETFWRYYRSPDERDLVRFLRLSRAEFDEVHSKIRCLLEHCPTHLRPIQDMERLAIFLRFIAFGPTYCAVAHLFAIGDSTVYDICKEVSQAIVTVMQAEFMPPPNRQTWERSAEGFARLREFPKTLGAVDGKHIAIVKPEHSGAAFFNYKVIPRSYTPCPIFHSCMFEKFYSIVLLAIADAESRFIAVDVGASGRNSDSTLWISSPLRSFLESPEADLPPSEEGMLPYVFLGDGGFGCTDLIMTPFTDRGADTQEKIAFNGRLSRARSAVEHAFEILAKRWRLFLGTIEARPEIAQLYTTAAVILHNYLNPSSMMTMEYIFAFRMIDDYLLIKERQKPEELEEELGNNLLML